MKSSHELQFHWILTYGFFSPFVFPSYLPSYFIFHRIQHPGTVLNAELYMGVYSYKKSLSFLGPIFFKAYPSYTWRPFLMTGGGGRE